MSFQELTGDRTPYYPDKEDIMAQDWEVQEQQFTVSVSVLVKAWAEAHKEVAWESKRVNQGYVEETLPGEIFARMLRKLGF